MILTILLHILAKIFAQPVQSCEQISATLEKNQSKVKAIHMKKELHLGKAQHFLDNMKEKHQNPSEDELVICFDLKKTYLCLLRTLQMNITKDNFGCIHVV